MNATPLNPLSLVYIDYIWTKAKKKQGVSTIEVLNKIPGIFIEILKFIKKLKKNYEKIGIFLNSTRYTKKEKS